MDLSAVFSALIASPEFAVFLLGLMGTAITGAVAFVSQAVRKFLNTKLNAEQLTLLMQIANRAVLAAEQTGLDKTGEQKKDEAVSIAVTFLAAYGIKVSGAQLEAAIEAAVYSGLTSQKEPLVINAAITQEVSAE